MIVSIGGVLVPLLVEDGLGYESLVIRNNDFSLVETVISTLVNQCPY